MCPEIIKAFTPSIGAWGHGGVLLPALSVAAI